MDETLKHPVIHTATLRVKDLELCTAYYRDAIGLEVRREREGRVTLGTPQRDLLVLENGAAAPHPRHSPGLYHVAYLLPDRPALARQLRHLAANGVELHGMSDHLVSEALYLSDPEGNGIEIYRDRRRNEWNWENGEVDMATTFLDVEGLLREPDSKAPWTGMPDETVIGHIHLQVSNLQASLPFYTHVLGLDVTTTSYPNALFLSRDGYHHHVGLNTWRSEGRPAAAPDAAGLDHFEFNAGTEDDLKALAQRADAAGCQVQNDGGALVLVDPSGIRVRAVVV